jgi:hypothetical protein
MANGNLKANRLRFTLQSFELWSGWCSLQTPVDDSGMCLPNGQVSCADSATTGKCIITNTISGQTMTVDSGKLDLCFDYWVCLCSKTSCVANLSGSGPTVSFDLVISGTEASGSVTGTFGDHNVHFTRDP